MNQHDKTERRNRYAKLRRITMSRSYRLRHLPKFGANRFAEGVGRRTWFARHKLCWIARVTWENRSIPNVAVASMGIHPWCSWYADRQLRKYWSTLSHRKARRQTHQDLKRLDFDPDAEVLVTSDDFFDPWQFT